jgi:polyferredoxin
MLPAQLSCTKQAMHRGGGGGSFHVLFHVFEQFLSRSMMLSWTPILTFMLGTHDFFILIFCIQERLCRMLIPYGIRFAPHLHDKRKEREKRRRKGMKQNKKTFVVAKVLFVSESMS